MESHSKTFGLRLNNLSQKVYGIYLRFWPVVLVLVLAVMAWVGAKDLLRASSTYGLGVRSDSVAYIWSARSLAAGEGLGRPDGNGNFKPMTHWPPLYPILLAIFPLVKIDVIQGARWLGTALVGANVLLAGITLARLTRSFWFALGGAVLVLFSPGMAETNQSIMTEPLYITLSLLAFLFLDNFIQEPHWKWLWLAGVFTSLSFLTRYVGLSLVVVGIITLFIQDARPIRQRAHELLVFVLICILPMAVWGLRNEVLAGSAANRALTYYPIAQTDFNQAIQTIQNWVMPAGTVFAIGIGKLALSVVAVLLAFAIARLRPKGERMSVQSNSHLAEIYQLYLGFYLVMIFASRMFFDPLITFFEQRILAPVFLSVLFLVIGLLQTFWITASRRRWWLGAMLAVFYLWSVYSFALLYRNQTDLLYNTMLDNGSGYAYKGVIDSPFADLLRKIPTTGVVFTSNVEKYYYLTGRSAFGFPFEFDQAFVNSVKGMMKLKPIYFISFNIEETRERAIQQEFPALQRTFGDPNVSIYSSQP